MLYSNWHGRVCVPQSIDISLVGRLVSLPGLIQVLRNVLALQLAHALDLVEIDHEALVVRVEQLNALSAKDRLMIRAIEVLDAVRMISAKLVLHGHFSFLEAASLILKVEVACGEHLIFFDDLVENVNVEREALRRVQLFDQLATDGAAHAVLMVQFTDAVGAQRVTTMNEDAGNALAHVVLEAAELADVETARLIVKLHDIHGGLARRVYLIHF